MSEVRQALDDLVEILRAEGWPYPRRKPLRLPHMVGYSREAGRQHRNLYIEVLDRP
jgi:hypothetical protein